MYKLWGAVVLIAGCATTEWHLHASGYAIQPMPDSPDFSFSVHKNQLKQLGGDVNGPKFRHFVGERLKWEGVCPSGWEALPCTDDGSCVARARHTVTMFGRCLAP